MNRAYAIISEVLSSQDNKYFLVEELVIKFGYNCAVLLGFLLNKFFYYTRMDQLFSHTTYGEGWFYLKIIDAESILHLSREEQDVCIRNLIKHDIIEVKTMGLPPKRYFRLNIEKIAEIMTSQEVVSNLRKTHKSSTEEPKRDFSGKAQKSLSTDECEPMCVKPTNINVGNTHIPQYIDNIRDIVTTPPYPHKGGTSVCEDPPLPKPEKKQIPPKKKPIVAKRAEFGSHVKLHLEEYGTLIEKYGRPTVDQIIEEMNDYCSASKPKGYNCYAAAIRQWIRRRREKELLDKSQGKPLSATEESRKARREVFDEWKKRNGDPKDNPHIIRFD